MAPSLDDPQIHPTVIVNMVGKMEQILANSWFPPVCQQFLSQKESLAGIHFFWSDQAIYSLLNLPSWLSTMFESPLVMGYVNQSQIDAFLPTLCDEISKKVPQKIQFLPQYAFTNKLNEILHNPKSRVINFK
jgi:hypothetical protein